MHATLIVILSLGIIWLVLDIVRESRRKEWFIRGYTRSCLEYDKSEYRIKSYTEEAGEKFDEDYGDRYNYI